MRKLKLVLLLGGLAAAFFVLKRRQPMRGGTKMGNKEIVRRFTEEPWENIDVLDELVSPDFVGYDPSMPEPIRGIEGMKDYTRMYKAAYPDGGLTAGQLVEEGDLVAVRWTGRGTQEGELMGIAPTGKEVTVSGMSFVRVSGGKVVEQWSNWDTLGMLVQLGAAKAPVSA